MENFKDRDRKNAMVLSYLTQNGIDKVKDLTETVLNSDMFEQQFQLFHIVKSIEFSFKTYGMRPVTSNDLLDLKSKLTQKLPIYIKVTAREVENNRFKDIEVSFKKLLNISDLNTKGLEAIGEFLYLRPSAEKEEYEVNSYLTRLTSLTKPRISEDIKHMGDI